MLIAKLNCVNNNLYIYVLASVDISLYQLICLLYYHEPDNCRDHMVSTYLSYILRAIRTRSINSIGWETK